MLKNNNEIIAETDEDLQLQAGMQLGDDERQYLLNTGMLFFNTQRIKPYLAAIRQYLQNTQPNERVWTLFKVQDIANNQLANYILSVAINPQN
ncbi:hypothetical protein H5S09_06290 [Limosilactobacillus sp. STM2_1]|uniref:Uncharacterized protein n=1 Tax=Limosilactobacillus rudii TaxID=2759755 RepID=A0A7W3YNJ7_9LACO|nr:hypothetical protein [Limosilactobacillus rudii]MBB1079500.1 hypothetical protein [Limosilactobacillus rudii]MBB1097546.1 hypothetical protein [Limosilactobacillus rudii]MCD7134656.1 hypothetical protein [Limosilactobacillus rudii]